MVNQRSPLSTTERALLGLGLLAFLVLLAFSARLSNNRFTVTAEIVAAGLLAVGIGVGWWRHIRMDNTKAHDD